MTTLPVVVIMMDMSSRSSSVAQTVSTEAPAPSWNRRAYWIAIGLFTVMFAYSAGWSLIDPSGTKIATAKLGYPGYLAVYPLATAKLLGLVAIHRRRSRTLTHFAFAGFLFDLLLALAGHIHTHDFPYGWLSVFGLVLWAAAFTMDTKRAAAEQR
jgi:DoxX-like family